MNKTIPRELTRRREADAVELRIQGLTQSEIAERIGISQQAVAKLLRRVDERVAAATNKDMERLRREQNDTLTEVLSAALEAWEDSREKPSTRNPHGDVRFLSVAVTASASLARLHGLDAPRKLELESPPEQPQIDPEAQRRMFADPELRRLALERSKRELELRQQEQSQGAGSMGRSIWNKSAGGLATNGSSNGH